MPTLNRFDPPAHISDSTTSEQRDDWSGIVSDFFRKRSTSTRDLLAQANRSSITRC